MGLSSVAIVDVDARHIVHVVQLDDLKGHHVDAKPIGQHLTRFRAVRKNVRVNGIERQLRTMGRLKHARMIKHPGREDHESCDHEHHQKAGSDHRTNHCDGNGAKEVGDLDFLDLF